MNEVSAAGCEVASWKRFPWGCFTGNFHGPGAAEGRRFLAQRLPLSLLCGSTGRSAAQHDDGEKESIPV